jgi:hypothetical protein
MILPLILLSLQFQAAPEPGLIISEILRSVDYPEEYHDRPLLIDRRAINVVWRETFEDSLDASLEDVVPRFGSQSRLRTAAEEDAVHCVRSETDFARCSVAENGVFFSIVELDEVRDGDEIRVVVRLRWASEQQYLRGYDMEIFLVKALPAAGGAEAWKVSRTGTAIVL